jgi:hypothetical protein
MFTESLLATGIHVTVLKESKRLILPRTSYRYRKHHRKSVDSESYRKIKPVSVDGFRTVVPLNNDFQRYSCDILSELAWR